MAAMGIPQEDIAREIGIRAPKTLRKYFRHELDSGATKANYKVKQTLYEMATSGKCVAATIFWDKTRNHSSQRGANDARQADPPPFIVACEQGGFSHDHA